MPHERREFYTGGIYHINQRGNNKAYIFDEQVDKAHFFELASRIKTDEGYHLLAYVLMDNHYHLLVEMMDAPIDRIMHKLNMGYSKYYNRKYGRVGTTFGSRYKCLHVTDQTQLLKTLQYILFNPVKAKMVSRPAD